MYATTRKENCVSKRFVDCAPGVTYVVKSTLDAVTEIIIPTTIGAALNDKHFSYQWRLAIHNELKKKIENNYEFEAMTTNLNSCKVVKGVWIFETKANSDTNAIDFKASWVNNDSTKITTMTYKSKIAGVNLTNVNVTQKGHTAVPENPIDDYEWCLAMETEIEEKHDDSPNTTLSCSPVGLWSTDLVPPTHNRHVVTCRSSLRTN